MIAQIWQKAQTAVKVKLEALQLNPQDLIARLFETYKGGLKRDI